MLEHNKPDFWEPIEPDVVIGFYPEVHFPFLPGRGKVLWESDEHKRARKERAHRKADSGGTLPDDLITVIARVDAYNLKGTPFYYGDRIALTLSPARQDLQRFTDDLKAEYEVFERRYGIREWLARREDE